ncbi:hypothetical protein COI69_32550 [Bacillus cereus]|uniref:Uncharacterized protein n=1 Tax=Bacillus cereus TaxID=1396 RepID=A0A9X7HJC1_BACCE|nr:hypothetical protein COE70_32775 [Bacillus cereus]PHG72056.1 hypothetical protein COI69_32550 [Bacillus cereus]
MFYFRSGRNVSNVVDCLNLNLYSNYEGAVQYYYIRTTDNIIIDLCISDFPEIFAIHKGFSDKQIRKIYNWNL